VSLSRHFLRRAWRLPARLFTRTFASLEAHPIWLRWLWVSLWYGVIFFLSALPAASSHNTQKLMGGVDVLNMLFRMAAHAGVFGVLGVLLYAALPHKYSSDLSSTDLPNSSSTPLPKLPLHLFTSVLTVTLVGLFGLSDELHQSFVPGRFFRWQDVATDCAGATVALWLLQRSWHYLQRYS
jgi:hypothetical protein